MLNHGHWCNKKFPNKENFTWQTVVDQRCRSTLLERNSCKNILDYIPFYGVLLAKAINLINSSDKHVEIILEKLHVKMRKRTLIINIFDHCHNLQEKKYCYHIGEILEPKFDIRGMKHRCFLSFAVEVRSLSITVDLCIYL